MERIEIVDSEKKIARRVMPAAEEPAWHAMSATYRNETKVRDELEARGVECWVPMRYEVVKKGAVKKRVLVPVIRNLIFVHERRSILLEIKKFIAHLQFKTMVKDGANVPIVVPVKQMEDFRKVCESYNDKVKVLLPGNISLSKGTRVRITDGEFKGVEGVFIKLDGNRSRSVVIEIPGASAVISVHVGPELIEIVE